MFGIHRPGVILETYFSFSEMCTYSISKIYFLSFLYIRYWNEIYYFYFLYSSLIISIHIHYKLHLILLIE